MLKMFCPDYRSSSLLNITTSWLLDKGIVRVILDVDNTLLPRDKMLPTESMINWLQKLKAEGIEVVLLSNNGGERLRQISNTVEVDAVSWAVKPTSWGFKRALKRFEKQQGKVLVIGDQLMTDVLGAKIMGFSVLWVHSLQGNEFIVTKVTRQIEKLLVRRLLAQGLLPEENNEVSTYSNGNCRKK